jgi:LGFP repeat
MGGAEGPLGCAMARESAVAGRPGAVQSFRNGATSFSPQQGEQMLVSVHLTGNDIIAEWNSTAPFRYDKFILRLDKDGTNILQADVGEGAGGRWSAPATGPGAYSVIVEGCHTNITGSNCPQSWTVPASIIVPPPTPAPPAQEPGSRCEIPPVGLIRERWLSLKADNGLMGCPTEAGRDVAGRRGKAMRFQNGEIAWSPDQGEKMVVSAFRERDRIVVDAGNPAPFSYSWLDVRLEYEGRDIGHESVPGAGGRAIIVPTGNEDHPDLAVVGEGTGNYTVTVEGCDDESGIIPGDSTDCPQGWTLPVTVFYRTEAADIDFSDLAVPRSVEDALRDKAERARRAAIMMADEAEFSTPWGDGETSNAIAMLYLIDSDVAHGLPARDRRRFGHRFGMLTEIENAVRDQTVHAKVGTPIGAPCKDSGEYDTALKGYVVLLYRYGRLLAPDVRYRMLRLMDQIGPHNPDLSSIGCFGVIIPETENHLWLIDSSRYLTNQLWAKHSTDPQFDNRRNGLADFLIGKLQANLTGDFIEYNSRPYSRYTWMAIQNLYDYAEDPAVKTAAQAVLDYLSGKAAVSMNDGRKNPPYRRRVSHNHADLFSPEADRIKKRFLAYTGPTPPMAELEPPNHVEKYAAPEILLAAATGYQPPNLLLEFMLNPAARSYYQRLNGPGGESYAAEPDFLISGGGAPTDYAYEVAGTFHKNEDLGLEEPTTLIPTGEGTTVNQMIRFAGVSHDRLQPAGLCVAPGFACGRQPTIPARYTANPACFLTRGAWTFVDVANDTCTRNRDFGFYAAVWGAGAGFGILEAVPEGKIGGITLRRFADETIARNRGRAFNQTGENRYTAFGGNEIRFDAGASTPMVRSTGIAAIDAAIRNTDPAGNKLAAGTVMDSVPGQPAMTVRNKASREILLLDLSDRTNPIRIVLEPDPLRRLLGHGVAYSVPEAEIREWLGNIYTPYPALAAAIERDFPEGGLSRPVDIDVVRWFYEEGQGAPSPRRVEDVDRQVLENALISAHNSRYGEKVTRIEQIRRGPPASVSARSPVEEAFDFIGRFNRAWSQANAVALDGIERMYAARVAFYGDAWSRERVLKEKRDFATRWPVRDYQFRPDMAASSCDPSGRCTVKGRVEWYAAQPAGDVISIGTAEVTMGLATIDGALVITSEDGRVTRRSSWP